MSIFLGVDGGGTQTTCVVGDARSLLATAIGGPSNVIRVGEERACASLQEAIRQACAAAAITPAQVNYTCMGISGAARTEIADIVRRAVSELLRGPIEIVGDMEIALQAAFGDAAGVIANAGTGSFAYGRDRAGRTARIGGWGFAISDEGSGHWIGRAAISASFRARDEGLETRLVPGILNTWKLSTFDDLVRAANASPTPDFSSIVPIVVAVADTGDDVARSVLTQAGTELARLVKLVIGRLFNHAETVRVAMTGSVLRQSPLVRQVFYNDLHSARPNTAVNSTVIEPVKGALELARKRGQAQ